MAVKFLRYFLIIFLVIMVFLLTKNPYALHYKPKKGEQPSIELFDVKDYEILPTGINSIVFSKKVEKYKAYDKFYQIDVLYKDKLNLISTLISDKALLRDSILYFTENVKYTRSDDLALNTQSVQYNLKTKVLSSKTSFELIKKDMKTIGDSFIYQMQEGIIEAKNVKSTIRMDK
ncbi:LPS export ABC transporter periplasmic protein LptC [Sulfurospirillum sp. 1612]|uniref:LPS export ABC transporter periplasmic protein LptC n=1 Tax=Sulfurospirillum sp. 1612 TaxID=3094835 RepID=UPI002F946989